MVEEKNGDWLKKGLGIAGIGLSKFIAAPFGNFTADIVVELGKVVAAEVIDLMQRSQSDVEKKRTAAALKVALDKTTARLEAGDSIRDDGFFRIKTGVLPTAQMVLDGVLTKAKAQYDERKVVLLGNLMVSATFDDSLTADDLSWMIETIDSLTYRELLIIAHFCSYKVSPWNSSTINHIYTRSPIILTQIQELRSLGLLSAISTFEVTIEISPSGRLLVGALDLATELDLYGSEVAHLIGEPDERLPGL